MATSTPTPDGGNWIQDRTFAIAVTLVAVFLGIASDVFLVTQSYFSKLLKSPYIAIDALALIVLLFAGGKQVKDAPNGGSDPWVINTMWIAGAIYILTPLIFFSLTKY